MNSVLHFQQQQRRFLNYLRSPKASAVPDGFSAERLEVYSGLLYNKFDESLSACFPVIRRILSADEWRSLLSDFIAEHPCRTPYYRKIPDEFLHYLQHERPASQERPFLAELAHFEWMELQLAIAEAESIPAKILSEEQMLNHPLVFAPVIKLMSYRWPVQTLAPNQLPTEAPATATHILGFRDSADTVQFIEINLATVHLLVLLCQGMSARQALGMMKGEITDAEFEVLCNCGVETLSDLNRRSAVVDVISDEQ